jgi:hypothetical protein
MFICCLFSLRLNQFEWYRANKDHDNARSILVDDDSHESNARDDLRIHDETQLLDKVVLDESVIIK